MADIKSFIRKWNGKTLQDDGCVVSKEFHSFQVAFFNAMRKIADSIGAEVVKPSYGHYDMSGFVKRGDRYVYFSYSNCGNRTHVVLKGDMAQYGALCPMFVRTAANDRDYRGGYNNWTTMETCEELIDRLLNKEHKSFL